MKYNYSFVLARSKMKYRSNCDAAVTAVTLLVTFFILLTKCDAGISLNYHQSSGNSLESYNNATLSFFFTADPQVSI